MKFINRYLRNLAPYSVASHAIWEVASDKRNEVLKLDWNEATVQPSPLVKKSIEALIKADNFYNLYPSTHNEELIDLLAKYCCVAADHVQYFASSDSLHEYLVRMYVSVGDPIIILGPTYDNFRLTCEAQGGRIVNHDYSDDFLLDKTAFELAIKSTSPTLVYVCNPNNPTGNVLETDFLEYLIKKFDNTAFLIDEAYYEFYGQTCKHLIDQLDNLFISRTFSKAFALANFRAGYLLSHPSNIKHVSKIRNPKNVSTFTQVAAISALTDLEYMRDYVAEVKLARSYFHEELIKLKFVEVVYKGEGNFILVKFVDNKSKKHVFDVLASHLIFVRNLTHRESLKNCLRITIGTRDQMKRVLTVLKQIDSEFSRL